MCERRPLVVALALIVAAACSHGPRVTTRVSGPDRGLASWYGEPYHGRPTASGEIYDMHQLTAAHRSLDFGTRVRVTRRDTGAAVEVRINDRGPFVEGRVIDLSYAAARRIGLDVDGLAAVDLEVLEGRGEPPPTPTVETPPPTPAGDCLWVQVGAFGDRGNATRARDRLREGGERVLLMEGPDGLQRVRVGPFTTAAEAEAAADRLRPEWPPAKVVPCGG